MQSIMLIALLIVFSVFGISEFSRNGNTDSVVNSVKAANIAANIEQYNDLVSQYMLANYYDLSVMVTKNPGHVENVKSINYVSDEINKYSQKELIPMLNYRSVAFNYSLDKNGNKEPIPVLYLATSWDDNAIMVNGYNGVQMIEIMGRLGQDLSKRLYQGDGTYWMIPWVFSQNDCDLTELFTQLPNDSDDKSKRNKLDALFKSFCDSLKETDYKFGKYVYIQPIFNPSS